MKIIVELPADKFMIIVFSIGDDTAVVESLPPNSLGQAYELMKQGEETGALGGRTREEFAVLGSHLVGCTINEDKLIGIAGLAPYENCAELVCLWVDVNCRGFGVASQLLKAVVEEAFVHGDRDYIFACTTFKRAVEFFIKHKFKEVQRSDVPKDKWKDYPLDRNPRVFILEGDSVFSS